MKSDMLFPWPEAVFSELYAERLRSGLNRPNSMRGHGVKMVNMSEIFAYDWIRNPEMERVPLSGEESSLFLLKPGDLLFARQSLKLEGAGKCSIVLEASELRTFESHLIRVRLDRTKADPFFYYYYYKSPRGRAAISSITEQMAAAGVRGSDLSRLRVPIPPLAEQSAVASILQALDSRVELNRQMNHTLEAMAQAIFKSWFVDFDPVIAKAAGRKPFGMDDETAALFGDRFMDSELGPIPAGWKVSSIGEEVRVVGGSTPQTDEPAFWSDGTIHWVTPRDLSRLYDPVVLGTERRITEGGLAQISSGLLPRGTVLLSSRAPIGYLAIAQVPLAVNQGFIAMVCNEALPTHYVLHWVQENMNEILSRAGGTTFAEVSKVSFRPIPVLVPSTPVLTAFESLVSPTYDRITANVRESHTLAALRDMLLPKLLSGEIRAKQAEKVVGGAV